MAQSSKHLLRLLALAALAAASVLTLKCERPVDPKVCERLRMACIPVEKDNCTAQGGTFIDRGSFCQYCHLCATFVGFGEQCNNTVNSSAPTKLVTVCKSPLVCSLRRNGTCVEEKDCEYE